MCQKLRITAPVYRGVAMFKSIESWVVGVNVCERGTSRFVDLMNIMREIITRDHVHPFGEWISIFL